MNKVEFVLHPKALKTSLTEAQRMLEIMQEGGSQKAPEADVQTITVKAKDGVIHTFQFLTLTFKP